MALAAFKPSPILKPITVTEDVVSAYSEKADDSAWMRAYRQKVLRIYKNTPAPTRIDEIWRRVDLSRFDLNKTLTSFKTSSSAVEMPKDWAVLNGSDAAQGWIMHLDGNCVEERVNDQLKAQGVIYASLASVSESNNDLLDNYLMTQCVKPSDTYFAAMHAVFMRGGVVLYVPAGVHIEAPLRAATWLSAECANAFHHTLVVLGDGAKATLIEEFASAKNTISDQAFVNSSVEIILGNSAQLDYVSIQDYGRHTYNFSSERAHVGKNSTLHWVIGGIGSKFTKSAIEADMLGANGTALLSGVYFADSKQQMHYDTQQNHIAEGCVSDLLYKAALRDEARTVWRGNIRVFPGAQKTDSYQANRNLQLSDKSRADSIPGLEIEADDVRCTHGATVGQIEDEPMFYLESRGIPKDEARRLIVEGFFAPVIERIPLEETRDRLLEEIRKKI
jgi:Fe-S cluster assembly protein SufD